MFNLFYKDKIIMKGSIEDFLYLMNQFTGAYIKTYDKVNFYLNL